MTRFIVSMILILGLVMQVKAQEISGGFKAGLNFAKLSGPSEMANDRSLEEHGRATGFHIGASVNFKLTDQFGFRTEFLYTQKGTEYRYDGPSYWLFFNQTGDRIFSLDGNRNTNLGITNSYIEIPIMAYGKFGRIEVSGGLSASLLVSSRASGGLTYSSQTIDPFAITLDFNYRSNELQGSEIEDTDNMIVAGETVAVPRTIGAYYAAFGDTDSYFNSFDLALNGGLAFYLNQGLYLGFRLNYGLLDQTKMEQDVSRVSLGEGNNFILRDDNDRNVTIMASIGFGF